MESTKFNNKLGQLRVATNQRYLEFDDGTPFFYLGDTAWELFHRLNREEAQFYLSNRAAKGFTVIQAVALAELGGTDVPNANGDLPLIDRDASKPNESYFRHVDAIVKMAGELGLFIGMLPTWGSSWKQAGGNENAIFNAENARNYGRFLGERYRDNAIIWILGGDNFVENEEEHAIIEAMAFGLKEGDGGAHLITFHPRGPGRSAEALHQAEWLDFNMCQSSHGAHDHDNGLFIEHDYILKPPKPTVDGEPRYEMIPVGFYYREVSRYDRFDAYDCRQAAYWALLAGACGHTYGHNCVWQMWTPERKPAIWANIPWYNSLDTPGAFQMGFVRRVFESHAYQDLIPAQDMIVDGPISGGAKIRAARSRIGTFAFIYSPRGEQFTIDKRVFKSSRATEAWFDPRYGCTYYDHTTVNAAFQTYVPPTSGRGNDWLLILEQE
ncbi:MAG: glycoside hydrolase family 140 protein [Anaerolineae bacterium]|nr:glycoside hydrolase family 140 protein [Anaerolineae bacterium]